MVSFTWRSLASWFGINNDSDDSGSNSAPFSPLSHTPVWYAVNKIGGHCGYLPLDIRKQSGRNTDKDLSHPSYRLFRWQPNAMQGPMQFKRALTADALLWGNGYAYIYREKGIVKEIIPLRAGSVIPEVFQGRKIYHYFVDLNDALARLDKDYQGRYACFEDHEILHIAGLGPQGMFGYSVIALARRSWEAGLGSTNRLNKLLKKGYAGGLMLSAPPGTSLSRDEEKAKSFLGQFREQHAGSDNSGAIGLLREGVTAQVMEMSNVDAQFVETMKFLRQEEALRFMLESILGDDTSVSYNSLEQKNLAYLQNCLNTWLCAWEEECDRKLLTETEKRNGYFHKFNVGPLLRSDLQTTMASISVGVTSRVLSPNEGREMLDRNPYEGGDEYLNPAIDKAEAEKGRQELEKASAPPKKSNASLAQIEHLLGVEAKRIAGFAKNSKNFTDRCEKFYARWESTLAEAIEKLGGDRDLAAEHCQASMDAIVEMTGNCTEDNLAASVDELIKSWSTRAVTLSEDIEDCNV